MNRTKTPPRLLLIGNARSGKDSMAEILQENFDLKFKSSSEAAAEIFIYDSLKEKYGYTTPEDCFNDRVNRRAEWYEMICGYNKYDKAKLAKEILKNSSCYVGMRDKEEIEECKRQKLFNLIVWIEAGDRVPLEDSSSFKIDKSFADIIIENNLDYETFKSKVIAFGNIFFKK